MRNTIWDPIAFPVPQGGASLVLACRFPSKTALILGSGFLAASRAFAALEADTSVVVLAKGGLDAACDEIRFRATKGQLGFIDWDSLPSSSTTSDPSGDIEALEFYLDNTPGVRLVCVTDTLLSNTQSPAQPRRTRASAEQILQAMQ
jgi:uroporphyrin-III C-methyltransferase